MTTVQDLGVGRGERIRLGVDSLIIFSASLVGSFLLTMLLWVVVPILVLGWHPTVVVSGSMRPVIDAGDVVLFEETADTIGSDTIIAFTRGDDVVVHRVLSAHDGLYTTKGDANARPDSEPVTRAQIMGKGRLLVPYVGLARVIGWVWWVAIAVILLAAVSLWRRASGLAMAVIAMTLVVAGLTAAVASFSATTASAFLSVRALDVAPPTGLTAQCDAVGAGNINVNLTWEASPTSPRDGYRILYDDASAGNSFVVVGTVSSSATTFTHQIPTELTSIGTHTYAVETFVGPWFSEMSDTDAVSVTQIVLAYACTNL